ncbi:MAG: alkaline phosphatase, partial [Phycisphaerae bacterium]|nr:alkaline phosphatase [Phycisphaerae bacterium]
MQHDTNKPNRRAFIRDGSLFLIGTGTGLPAASALLAAPAQARPRVRIGLVTDLHYADKPPAGSRHYRDTLKKLSEAAEHFERDKPDCIVELGDFIDAADSVQAEKSYLKR